MPCKTVFLKKLHFSFTKGTSVIQRPAFGSGGHVLGASPRSTTTSSVTPSENIRNIWANKFIDRKDEPSTSSADSDRSTNKNKITEPSSAWEEIDDDILIHSVQNTIIEIDDGSSDSSAAAPTTDDVAGPSTHSTDESKPQISIKRELLDDLGEDDENIEMIDDEFDDTLNQSMEILTDTSVIDELFGNYSFLEIH